MARGVPDLALVVIIDVGVIGCIAAFNLTKQRGAICGKNTTRCSIECEYGFNCSGMWTRELSRMVGVSVTDCVEGQTETNRRKPEWKQ